MKRDNDASFCNRVLENKMASLGSFMNKTYPF